MLLLFEYQGRIALALAHQRNSLADSTKNTLEDLWLSDFLYQEDTLFAHLHHDKQRFSHFYDYYSGLVDMLCQELALRAGAPAVSGEQARRILHDLASLDSQIVGLRTELKRESRFNRKMELNIAIKKLETAKKALLTPKNGAIGDT